MKKFFLPGIFLFAGCAALFGWDIHAPGMMSYGFAQRIQPVNERIALYADPAAWNFQSRDRGSRTADPQTYHVGEAFVPMLIEGFQQAFDEFVFMEVEPTADILKQYGIPRLAVVRIRGFKNRVTWSGEGELQLFTETIMLDQNLRQIVRFESQGVSDAEKIFAKKGGPEVNLNAAIENNIRAIVQHVQDSLRTGAWQ